MAVERILEGTVQTVRDQGWLDPAAGRVQRGLQALFAAGGGAGRAVKNFLHGTWLGHPLHPVLVGVPIGAWTVAAVLDGLEASSGRRELGSGADASVAVGLAGALAAAAAGATDWTHTNGNARRVGAAHALLNTGAVLLYGASWVLRRRGQRRAGRGLSSIGYAIGFASAYLGGHLVYAERVGVDHAGRGPSPEDFVPVLPETDLDEGRPRRVGAAGTAVVLVRRSGRILALQETCSHMGGPLADGSLDGEGIRCPWHGSRFSVDDGRVLDGPATRPQPCFEARVRDGRIEVRRAR